MTDSFDGDLLHFSDEEAAYEVWRDGEEKPKTNEHSHKPEPLLPINPTTLEGSPVPPRQWLVSNWIPMARVTALYGAGGEGKTLLAQMLATACAINKPWLGLTVRHCRSLLVFCEDDLEEMQRRQADINAHYGCRFADLAAMGWLPRLGHENELMTFKDGRRTPTPLLGQILDVAREHGAQFVVIDTLADVFSGNESDRAQARAFTQVALGYIARETRGALLALAHPSLSGMGSGSGTSGSTGWLGTFRSHLYLTTPQSDEGMPADHDLREITRTKANFARRGETIALHWQNGIFVADKAPVGIIGSIGHRTCDRVFLGLLRRTNSEGRRVSPKLTASNFAPSMFAKRPDREGFKKTDFRQPMERLIPAGKVKITPYKGSNRTVYECLEAVGDAE